MPTPKTNQTSGSVAVPKPIARERNPRTGAGTVELDQSGRKNPLYRQIVKELRDQIDSGALGPNAPLPSQGQLERKYGVSRETARRALAELRLLGLIIIEHGRAARVRPVPISESGHIDFAVRRDGHRYVTWDSKRRWSLAAEPQIFRTDADSYAVPLELPNPAVPVIVGERVLEHENGSLAVHRYVIPFSSVNEQLETALESTAFMLPAEIYQVLAASSGPISWLDDIGAALPNSEEVEILKVLPSNPLIVHTRVTLDRLGHPLILEETRMPSGALRITHTQRADTPT